MNFVIKKIVERLKRKFCDHNDFKVLGKFGPTSGRHKTWVSCRCNDCGQYFVFEEHEGKKILRDGPGFGFHKI